MKDKKRPFDKLYENATIASADHGLPAGQQQTVNPMQANISIVDFINQQNELRKKNRENPQILPFPITDTVGDKIGQLYIDTTSLRDIFTEAAKTFELRKDKNKHNSLANIVNQFEDILETLRKISVDMEKLEVD